jgi:DNA mismatch repair protein MutS
MHSVKSGPANQSYGLQVAQLAGVPRNVIGNAKKRLKMLEAGQHETPIISSPQIGLFEVATEPEAPHPIIESLTEIDVNNLTPRQALDLIYDLKEQL